MERKITEFDEEFEKIAEERIEIMPHVSMLELQLYVLHQETIIVKEFETAEDALLAVMTW